MKLDLNNPVRLWPLLGVSLSGTNGDDITGHELVGYARVTVKSQLRRSLWESLVGSQFSLLGHAMWTRRGDRLP